MLSDLDKDPIIPGLLRTPAKSEGSSAKEFCIVSEFMSFFFLDSSVVSVPLFFCPEATAGLFRQARGTGVAA